MYQFFKILFNLLARSLYISEESTHESFPPLLSYDPLEIIVPVQLFHESIVVSLHDHIAQTLSLEPIVTDVEYFERQQCFCKSANGLRGSGSLRVYLGSPNLPSLNVF